MINFSEKELDYIKEMCEAVIESCEEIDNETAEEGTKEWIDGIGKNTIMSAIKILNNPNILKEANINKEYNLLIADTIYWIDGLWVWVDNGFTLAEEMYKYMEIEDSCSIFEKIMNEETEDGVETSNQKGVLKWLSRIVD